VDGLVQALATGRPGWLAAMMFSNLETFWQ